MNDPFTKLTLGLFSSIMTLNDHIDEMILENRKSKVGDAPAELYDPDIIDLDEYEAIHKGENKK